MTIAEGFKDIHNALFGDCTPCGKCSRCKANLIISARDGNAQSWHTFVFHWKQKQYGEDGGPPWGILMGMPGRFFEWEADLCNQCLIALELFVNGAKLFPSEISCNQNCDGIWRHRNINDLGQFVWCCDKCNYQMPGIVM